MVHLTNTLRSATFLIGTAMLILFFFCAPMHAQTPTFKSTSSYKIANPNYSSQQIDPTTIGHQTYRSTIYTPFGSSTPSSNNPSGNSGSGGSGDPDDDVGIPGWADTPSEPLPIGDGMGILLLMATMMVGAIFLKQRKQLSESISKSTTSTTNINNLRGNQLPTALKKENTTTHMTTRKQTYKSFCQKLFLLLAFVCAVGQVSGQIVTQTGNLLKVTQLFKRTPTNFPVHGSGNYQYAQQGTYVNGEFFTSDYNNWVDNGNGIIRITTSGKLELYEENIGNLKHGICSDDAGNVIIDISPNKAEPTKLLIYKNGDKNQRYTIDITLKNNGETHFPTASGDIFSETGGYVYFFPNGKKCVEIVKIANGNYKSTTTSAPLSTTASTAGYVIPINNNPNHFIYQVRGPGYYLYQNGQDKGLLADWAKETNSSVTQPARNSSVGGAFFRLGDKDFILHMSGTNYAGGWTIRNYSASNHPVMCYSKPLGDGTNNTSVGSFFTWKRVDNYTIDLFEYCMGHGIAGWRISTNTIPSLSGMEYCIQTYGQKANGTWDWLDTSTGGSVSINEDGNQTKTILNNPSLHTIWHKSSANVTVTAIPNQDYTCIGFLNNVYDANGIPVPFLSPWTFIPNSANNTRVTARFAKLFSQTIKNTTFNTSTTKFEENTIGGTVNFVYNNGISTQTIENLTSGTYKALEQSTCTLTATPKAGYIFIGWYNGAQPITADATHTFNASVANTITARFEQDNPKKDVRAQTLVYESGKWDWKDNNTGGTFTMTHSGGTVYTHTTDGYVKNIMVDKAHPVIFDAAANVGYTFIGWWNNPTVYTDDPWIMENPANYKQSVTARFAPSRQQTISIHTYDKNQDKYVLSGDGGSVSISYSKIIIGSGYGDATETVTTQGTYTALYNTSITLTATPNTNYAFLGWYEGENKVGSNTTYTYTATTDRNITARFHKPFTQAFDVQTEIGGQYQNSTTGGTATISYNDGTKTADIGSSTLSITDMYQGSMNTLTATPKSGYRFVGWYNGSGELDSSEPEYIYRAEETRTVHARFAPSNITLSVAVLNYNPEYDKFEEYGYEYNTITLKENSRILKESYSSFKHKFENATTVTLTATPEEGEDGYDFVGWYINNEKLTAKGSNSLYTLASDASTELTLNLSGAVAVNAHFAPKKCWKVTLDANAWGKYTLQYSKDSKFSTFQSIESSYTQPIYTFVPYKAYVKVSSVQPIHGYTYLRYKRGGSLAAIGTPIQCSANNHNIQVELVRDEEQVVYLDLRGANDALGWAPSNDPNKYAYYAFVDNEFYSTDIKRKWIRMEHVNDYCYRCTISPANRFNKVNFVQVYIDSNGKPTTKDGTPVNIVLDNNETYSLADIRDTYKVQKIRSGAQTIPSTRYNCYRIKGIYSSNTGNGESGYVDGWVAPPTTTGDFRLIYREQTVVDKNTIDIDYEFNEGDRIKKISSGTKLDTVSLHIYNKVSGNVNGVNNPEVILQQWSDNEDDWVDVERYMVFGPLRSNDASVIKMPNRKNTADEVVRVDLGINNIMTNKTDNGCGVWNFVIEQDGTTARLLVDETHRYTGNYYIRTSNADGQYHNFTHPGNIMSFSEYAKKYSNYSHYFIRYVDIYEDGTKTAEAGKHPVVKFCVATDYAYSICRELLNVDERFKDERKEDVYVINDNDLPSDATVRFGWDIKTNRLTRAYIASTFHKNNEYLVVEGSNIGSPSGEATYFNDNSNYLYSIDLNATKNATAKVKAKMNGKYQYFMGTNAAGETLISGSGANIYPIRLLYDFKDDRFTTIYRPDGQLEGTINVNTPLLIERVHNYEPTQIKLTTNEHTVTPTGSGEDQYTQPAYAVMTFLESVLADASKTHHEKMFYWISFPFDVRISDVFGLGEYGKYWIMEEYDGAQRAQSGLAKSNWKYITKKSAVLSKNVGYVLCLNYSQILQDQLFKSYGSQDENLTGGRLSLYFPSNGIVDPKSIVGGQNATIDLAEYYNANTAWNHHNWHIIGVPSFANPGTIDEQQDAPFVYQYWHPGDAYAAVSINDVEFQSMHAYMVQYTGEITWTNKIVNTGGSVSGGKSLAAKKDADADKKIMLRLELQQAGSTLDKTYVQLRNDKGTKGFDMSLDLTKIINAGANIYSIVDNHEMAGNAIPKDETVLPLGVVITAAGEYTFAMPNGTEGIIVELIDYEQGTSTNLLMSDYTITLDKGTFNQRFALRLVPDKVATSVDNIGNGANGDEVRKLLIDGVLYLQKGNNTYDAQGKHVQ